MNIKVSRASSFFQEEGLDGNGIMRLLYNAAAREMYSQPIVTGQDLYSEFTNVLILAGKDGALQSMIAGAIENFCPNMGQAENRILKFYQDHARHKEIDQELNKLSFWKYLFKRTPKIKKLIAERRELEEMEITLKEMVNIAHYKYVKGNYGTTEEFIAAYRAFFPGNTGNK